MRKYDGGFKFECASSQVGLDIKDAGNSTTRLNLNLIVFERDGFHDPALLRCRLAYDSNCLICLNLARPSLGVGSV